MEENQIRLPILALRGLVVFPQMVIHFDAARDKSINAINAAMENDQQIFLITQRLIAVDDPDFRDLYDVGVVARIKQILKMPGDIVRVMVKGEYRARICEFQNSSKMLQGTVERLYDVMPRKSAAEMQAIVRLTHARFHEYVELSPKLSPDIIMAAETMTDAGKLADFLAGNINLQYQQRQPVLDELNVYKRIYYMLTLLYQENQLLELEHEIQDKVREQVDENQRDYYLREQMKAISAELGEGESPIEEADEYIEKISELSAGDDVKEALCDEANKLAKMPLGSHEATVVRGYLDTCLALPWGVYTKDKTDVARAEKILNKDHYGIEKVKERILELIAAYCFNPDIKGQIICLAGPPGVGKTSVAASIARAMGCKYVRVSLGGSRDEADIRGHRKTYIGAMPGRIINAVKQAGSANPLILLDEIDKLGADFKGDPASALLEALDPEQNFAFRDHYIELPFDLSRVLFITTANDVGNIPAPLLDRMELIELPSYTAEEKFHIAKRHLLPKQKKAHGLKAADFRMTDNAIRLIIDGYTREAGVRVLERQLAAVCRKSVKMLVSGDKQKITVDEKMLTEMLGTVKYQDDEFISADSVGVCNGLAWTSVGGTMLPVEALIMDGSGKVELTGSLGDVMKESAHIAISIIRAHCGEWRIDKDFYKNRDIHIHAPEGAVPKDGPSAGVTMCTALVSALTNIPVRSDIAMTGEISLRGSVLPIGGLREKAMAAYRHGIKTVIIPSRNAPDLADIDKAVTDSVRFIPVSDIAEVLELALTAKLPAEEKTEAEKIAVTPHTESGKPAMRM